MDSNLEMKLWNAVQGGEYIHAIWRNIIKSLLDDFALFIGKAFVRDQKIALKPSPPSPSFSQWIWSSFKPGPLSVAWSAVIAGNISIISDGSESFVVVLDMFLFNAANHRRLCTKKGESVIEFVFEPRAGELGRWRCVDWCIDEWGEWESIEYPGGDSTSRSRKRGQT